MINIYFCRSTVHMHCDPMLLWGTSFNIDEISFMAIISTKTLHCIWYAIHGTAVSTSAGMPPSYQPSHSVMPWRVSSLISFSFLMTLQAVNNILFNFKTYLTL